MWKLNEYLEIDIIPITLGSYQSFSYCCTTIFENDREKKKREKNIHSLQRE